MLVLKRKVRGLDGLIVRVPPSAKTQVIRIVVAGANPDEGTVGIGIEADRSIRIVREEVDRGEE